MSGGRGDRILKELTLIVDVADNRSVSAQSIIEEAEGICGDGNILAVVPRSGNLYEITVRYQNNSDDLCNSPFQVSGKRFQCHAVYSKERVVSFLHLPAFIPDSDIFKKLQEFGVEVKSDIKRRFYPGTEVADGTRYVVVKFPPNVSSLPYTVKFDMGNNKFEYIRVKHDNQNKVCSKCLSDEHLYASCPDNKCYRCNSYGHISKFCPTEPCEHCEKYPSKCKCASGDDSEQPNHSRPGPFTGKTWQQDEADHLSSATPDNSKSEGNSDEGAQDNTTETAPDNVEMREQHDDADDDDENEDDDDEQTVENDSQDDNDDEINEEMVDDAQESDERCDDKLELNDNNDNVDLNLKCGENNETFERGECVSIACDESEVVVQENRTTSSEKSKSDAISPSENKSEVDMDDVEMAKHMLNVGGKFRRNRLNVRPNIPYDRRHSANTTQKQS